jgi:hypothetical protein
MSIGSPKNVKCGAERNGRFGVSAGPAAPGSATPDDDVPSDSPDSPASSPHPSPLAALHYPPAGQMAATTTARRAAATALLLLAFFVLPAASAQISVSALGGDPSPTGRQDSTAPLDSSRLVEACQRGAAPDEIAELAERVANGPEGRKGLDRLFHESADGRWGPSPRHLNWSPLYWAIMHKHGPLALRLIELGAAADGPGHDNAPLLRACMFGDELVVRALLANGADPNAKNVNGTTALMFAIERGHLRIARQLLAAGADASVRETLGGRTARDIRRAKGFSAKELHLPGDSD